MSETIDRSATPAAAAPHQLERTLGLRAVTLFGLAYLAPLIVLGTFGVLAQKSAGTTASAYLLSLVAMLFTAYSYGKMAARFPIAGSAYTFTRRSIGSRIGFMIGWAILLDYFFIPMAIWLIGAAFLNAAFPAVPPWLWIIGFIALTSGLNLVGVRLAANVNSLLMVFQLSVLGIFILLSLRHVVGIGGAGAAFSGAPWLNPQTTLAGVAAGAALAAYSFLGFDAVTTMTEEAVNPTKTIPRAILLIILLGGGMFILASYATQLVHPGGVFKSVDSAAFDIAKTIGGDLWSSIFLGGLILAQFTSGISAQAAVSRLLYAMGRDSVLPKRFFGYIHPRFRTPALNILLAGATGLIALRLSVATSTSFINFGAFTAFTFVNLSVIALFFRGRSGHGWKRVVTEFVAPAIGAVVDVFLLLNLANDAKLLGTIWLTLGLLYLVYLTRGFRVAPPEVAWEE
ncbi:MAG: APC family permease [Candidatus Dormibacteraeota bacterium]|nr:APC family permease [Candidatus Dormibacteraeota bacterium]